MIWSSMRRRPGWAGDPLPVDVARLDGTFVADIITMPLLTPLLAAAQGQGLRHAERSGDVRRAGGLHREFLLGA